MKSLYESILSSTRSGAIEMIKKWCEENLNFWKSPGLMKSNDFVIQSDGKITNVPNLNIDLRWVKERVPDYIKFGEITENFYVSNALKYMTQNQLPPKVKLLYISGQLGTIPSFKMECTQGLDISDYPQDLKHIDPIYLECHSTNGATKKPSIDLRLSQIGLEDLKNIHITGDIYDLNIRQTPAAKELHKMMRRIENQAKRNGYVPDKNTAPPYEEYLDELFNPKDWPGLRFIYLSDWTMLEHNPRTNHWLLLKHGY